MSATKQLNLLYADGDVSQKSRELIEKNDPTIWLVFGVSSSGKTTFLEEQLRISEITGCPLGIPIKPNRSNNPRRGRCAPNLPKWHSLDIKQLRKNVYTYIHLEMRNGKGKGGKVLKEIISFPIERKAIILGVPRHTLAEHKKKRKDRARNRGTPKQSALISRYQKLVSFLEKKKIPYLFVAGKDNYPILNKEDFFQMLGE